MKPSFALSFTEDSIQLLHRAGKGWVVIGETPFDAPDLDDALDYMRRTALGLEPAGISTKLVIPNSQIRYLEMDAPGPSDEERVAQIRAGLDGKTPYAAEELVFDWSGKGKLVRVAVLARETLQEAEAFATTHRFNPLSFVAIPDYGDFNGEPWFGATDAAATLVAAGEEVERDRASIRILTRGSAPKAETAPAPEANASDASDEAALSAALADPAPTEDIPAPAAAIAAPEAAILAPAPEPVVTAEPAAAAAEPAPAPVQLRVNSISVPQPVPPPPEPEPELEPFTPFAKPDPARHHPDPVTASPLPGSAEAWLDESEPAAPAAEPEPEVEEAPFTFAHDDTAFPEEDDDLRAADPVPPLKSGRAPDPLTDPATADDLPPAPSSAAMLAFASRRRGGDGGQAPALGAAERPDPAALARAARGKPVEDLPPMPRPPQAGAPAVRTAAKGIGGLVGAQGIGAGRKPAKVKPMPQPSAPARVAAAVAASGAGDAAKSLTRPGGTFGNNPPPKQRSRTVLFLSLVAILLLCMALVAAWSTLFLASNRGDSQDTVQVAAEDVPGVDDEMLADGEGDLIDADIAAETATDTTELAAAEPMATEEPVAEAAPDTAVTTDSPPAQVLAENQDEIFLATSDAPPPALDALALPVPGATEDALPADQMPPPPFGTVYAFDDNGLLIPTKEGIVNPDGVMLIAGKPPKVPPSRSEVAAAAALAAAALATPPAAPTEGALVEALPVGTAAPAPGATAAGAIEPESAETGEPAQPVGAEAQPNPELVDRKPKERPAELVVTQDDAALATELPKGAQTASLRPRERPRTVLAAAETARQQTETASLALAPSTEEAAQAEAELAAATAAEAANPSVVAISRRPEARPKDFSRAVEAAVAAAIRTPEPEPEPEPEPVATKKTAAKAPAKVEEDDSEPEVAASAAPKIPSSASVAKQATYKNALNLSKVNLIGVYGTPSKRYALVRQANGKYKKVSVGDKIDGGRVEAITPTELRYQKGGRLISLAMPKG